MTERLVIAAVIIVAGALAWVALNRLALRRLHDRAPRDPLLRTVRPGAPTIIYFTTPSCAPCRTQQMPALKQLQAEFRAPLQVIQVDATEDTDAADRWGVFSAPTTFILDRDGRPRHVNRGVASADVLRRQLEAVS
ncbi:MAG: conjugal transfer protein TraF [Anaerolineae bacterium]|nr:conjugal transfer protein TraF [Anaerolineae bacterium]